MKAKILLRIGLAIAVLCVIGIIITAWEHDIFDEIAGIKIGVSMLVLLLGFYIISLVLKKQKMLWLIIFVWLVLWIVCFILDALEPHSGFSSGLGSFIIIVIAWPLFVYEIFWGYSKFLDSFIGLICVHSSITALLCIGALGLKRPKRVNNKTSENILTKKINNEAE